jgi:hypothetical protein
MSPLKVRRNTENIFTLRKIIDKFLRTRASEVCWLFLYLQKESVTVVERFDEGNWTKGSLSTKCVEGVTTL